MWYYIQAFERSAYAPVAQLDRVTDYESVGRGFESLLAYHKKQPFSPENGCFSNFLMVAKVTDPTTWGLFGVYASGGQCFSNFLT